MKFNIGDKCKVIKDGTHGFEVGEEVEIIEIIDDYSPAQPYLAMNSSGNQWYMYEDEMELINKAEKEDTVVSVIKKSSRKFEYVSRIKNTEFSLPKRSTKNSAGYDFINPEDIIIPPYKLGDKPLLVPTGVKVLMPENEFLMLVNRSSNPKKKNLVIPNSLGVIDADFYGNPDNEGEMMFAFYNLGTQPVEIKAGEKLGQGIFMKYEITDDDNAEGERVGGFGSTDIKNNKEN